MSVRTESIHPRKSLGQNFLIDDNIARKIIRAAQIEGGDLVLEIGPGKGALTKYLVEQAECVVAVEIDRRAADLLERQFEKQQASHRLYVKRADFLSVDLWQLSRKFGKRIRVLGNIPYYITSPILFRVIEQSEVIDDLTILVQLEVGKRIVAKPNTKDYGILTIFCQFYGSPKLLFKVPPTAFYPKPKVVSALLQMKFVGRPAYEVIDEEIFVAVVRATFGKRRKTLRNGLRYLSLEGLDLTKLHFDLNLRPEQLLVEDFVELSNEIALQIGTPSAVENMRKWTGRER